MEQCILIAAAFLKRTKRDGAARGRGQGGGRWEERGGGCRTSHHPAGWWGDQDLLCPVNPLGSRPRRQRGQSPAPGAQG